MKTRHFLSIADLSKKEIEFLIKKALEIKKNPEKYSQNLRNKTLFMLFEAPSLRTRVSFEAGMTQLGGHAIYYDIAQSTLGKKESVKDFTKTTERYCDMIMARLYDHRQIEEMAANASIPVINAMSNREHPCQILSDLMTIQEKKGALKGKLAYLGDGLNNTTHSLLLGCSIAGMNIAVASPKGKDYEPDKKIVAEAKRLAAKSGSKILITNDAKEAVESADVVYTDSWMSYHIPAEQEKERERIFRPYKVNVPLMKHAKKNALFMHCLPAKRGQEVTDDVMDSRQSIVFDQAENRMHAQKALMLRLAGKIR
ncbi:MAG: ornithine carbamoyltransferase [Candidatus Aenigmarchaeota archaeon]|nr:ornithine carbamoyltransferase [Candidatus Aenigmarchaeota archaeon]